MGNAPLLFLAFVFLSLHLGIKGATCPSLDISYPSMRTRLCPRDSITYTCGLIGATNMGATITTTWIGSGFMCPATPNSLANTIVISQVAGSSLNTVPGSCGNLSAVMTNINGTCYTSVLTIPTPQYFNGTTFMCRDSNANVIGNDTLNIQLESRPITPNITIAMRNTSLNWFTVVLEPLQSNATNYSVSVNDSAPVTVPAASIYNGIIMDRSIILESIPSNGATHFTLNFSNVTNTTYYSISVVAMNCAGSSMPGTITIGPNDLSASSSIISVSTTTSVPTSTNMPTSQSATSVGIPVGVSIGIVVLVLLVAIAVIIVVIVKNKKESPPSPTENSCGKNEVPLPPRNSDTTLNKPKTDKTSNKPEGLIYADIGLPRKPPMQAPNPEDMNTVVYSSVQKVL